MGSESTKTLDDIVKAVGRYPEEAYHFVREGLGYAVERVHGPPTAAQMRVTQYMAQNAMDLTDLYEQFEAGTIEPDLAAAIKAAGGFEQLNRHVSGQELCWALRDIALDRWGPLAAVVLHGWGVTGTVDFGRIVFALIEHGLMQKEPQDRLDDFDRVFDFNEALTHSFRFGEKHADPPQTD